MELRRNLKYRIYPTPEQEAVLLKWGGVLRFLWNLCHEQRLLGLARPRDERRFVNHYEQKRQMTELLEMYPWIAEVQCQARQEVLADLEKAWSRCFKRIGGQPKFKKRSDSMRIYAPTKTVPFELVGNTLVFGGPRYQPLGPLKIVLDRPVRGVVSSWTIKREVDEWYAIAGCNYEVDEMVSRPESIVGIDLGCVKMIADSDGRTVESPGFYGTHEAKLKRLQRQASRKAKGSRNKKKALLKVARLQRRIARQREVVIGTESLYYATHYTKVVVEDLNIKGMTGSAKGTLEEPGTQVRQKAGLNRAILGSGWGKFNEALAYKMAERGGEVVRVDPRFTSQTCANCGKVSSENRTSQSAFRCTSCGYEKNADINAACVIKSRGLNTVKTKTSSKKIFTRGRKSSGEKTAVKPTVVQPAEDTPQGDQ